jgi:C-terminal peptidase prc
MYLLKQQWLYLEGAMDMQKMRAIQKVQAMERVLKESTPFSSLFKQMKFLVGALLLNAVFMACGTIELEPEDPSWSSEINNYYDSDEELYWNWVLLKGGYFYEEELKSFSEYGDKGGDSSEQVQATSAMYASLSDQFTRYFDPSIAEEVTNYLMSTESTGEYGFMWQSWEEEGAEGFEIRHIAPESPAGEAGLSEGDRLVVVDGDTLTGLSLSGQESLLEGALDPEDDAVELVVLRGEEYIHIEMERGVVKWPSVWLDFENGVPMLTITRFVASSLSDAVGTGDEVEMMLDSLRRTIELDSLIIDLRNNGGGLISEAQHIAELFLAQDVFFAKEVSRVFPEQDWEVKFDTNTYYMENSGDDGEGLSLLILINEGTASSSEILGAALRDQVASCELVGTTSYGKGIGQGVYDTPLNGLALITGLQFYRESGESWHQAGLEPDISTEEDALEVALDHWQHSDEVLVKKSQPALVRSIEEKGMRSAEWGGAYRLMR